MTDDNNDNPWTRPISKKEAKRWWYAMLIVGMIPLVLLAIPLVMLTIKLDPFRIFDEYSWISSAIGWSFIGVPASFVAIFITSWWRLGLIYQSLILLACNIAVFLFFAWILIITSA